MSRVQSWLVALVMCVGACEFLGTSALQSGSDPGGAAHAGDSSESGSGGEDGGSSGETNGGAHAGGGEDGGSGAASGRGNGGNGASTSHGGTVSGGDGAGAEATGGSGGSGGDGAGAEATGGSGGSADGGSAGGGDECGEPVPGMACVRGGTFELEWPDLTVRLVTVASFELDITEVTVDAYQVCVDAGGCQIGADASAGADCNYPQPTHGNYPMNCVTWSDANRFCTWAEKRLPTQEEDAFAAQRPDGRPYAWGNLPPDVTRVNGCGEECSTDTELHWNDGYVDSSPVGAFPAGATADGIMDLSGNVYEWTATYHCIDWYQFCGNCGPGGDCDSSCAGCPTLFPLCHGASYSNWDYRAFTSGQSAAAPPGVSGGNLGFRCAR